MSTVTIPKELSKNKDLVAVPRRTYEEFLAWQKKVKSERMFVPTLTEKKALAKARRNFSKGDYITLEKLENELGINR